MTDQTEEAVILHKKYIAIGVIVLVIIAVGVVSYLIGSQNTQITGGIIGAGQKQSCPFECCINDKNYENRICQGSNYQCINNKCVKTNCPYECCIEGEYSVKTCPTDYDCQNNKCVAIDSDKDGLTDIEEKQLGTNLNLYDSDGDTLSDYQEVKVLKTSPLNTNTDRDRYNDNLDPNPTTKNSASLSVQTINKEWNWDIVNIGILIGTLGLGGALNPDLVIANPSTTITVSNDGNDYSSYVNFEIIFEIANNEIDRQKISLSKINVGDKITDTYSKEIKIRDIPETIFNVVIDYINRQTTNWDIKTKNVNYEKF